MVYRNKASDCLRPPLVDTLPTKCLQLKKGFGECKRGMVDMRKRFRGNQPIAVSKEIEGGADYTLKNGINIYAKVSEVLYDKANSTRIQAGFSHANFGL